MTVSVDPNFKSSLPPRKRAKTDEEKEQRRVERILRNRRAAHASREKKRKHVEYLEAYVLALENNMATLSANYAKVKDLVSEEKLAGVSLPELDDLSELRDRTHSNLSMACPSMSMSGSTYDSYEFSNSHDADEFSNSHDADADGDFESTGQRSPSVLVKREPEDSSQLPAPSSGYFNYMSPVSINSLANSPINLTLKSHDASSSPDSDFSPATPEISTTVSEDLIIGSATSGINFMAQNSEVILSPRVLRVCKLSLPYSTAKSMWLLLTVLCLSLPSASMRALEQPRKRILIWNQRPVGRFFQINMRGSFELLYP